MQKFVVIALWIDLDNKIIGQKEVFFDKGDAKNHIRELMRVKRKDIALDEIIVEDEKGKTLARFVNGFWE